MIIKRLPAHGELGVCRTSLVSPSLDHFISSLMQRYTVQTLPLQGAQDGKLWIKLKCVCLLDLIYQVRDNLQVLPCL